ncbi:MAG: hypothetical protein JRE19_12595 [Deltaproteobacteria bacterium]|nr:hypothetical protein [Deltaproteobacteria bacterium]
MRILVQDLSQPIYLVAHRALRHLPRYDVVWRFIAKLLAEAAEEATR